LKSWVNPTPESLVEAGRAPSLVVAA